MKLMPTNASERKSIPVYTGFQVYFPDAILAVAKLSLLGGLQHGQTAETLRWDRSKSGDECDAMMRHMLEGEWESVAWRAMAQLQKKIEQGYVPKGFEKQQDEPRPVKEDLPPSILECEGNKWMILDGGFFQYCKGSCAPIGGISIECGARDLRHLYSQHLASKQQQDEPRPVKEDLPPPYERINKYKWSILDYGFFEYLRKNSCAPIREGQIACGKSYLRHMYSQYIAGKPQDDQPQQADGPAA